MTQLIGICGAAGAGKSTVAKCLVDNAGAKRLRLADGLKKMLRCIGLTEAQVDGDEKLIGLPLLCGNTPRYAMVTLGTEWGRDMMGADFWMNLCAMQITDELVKNEVKLIIVDDIRFENEVQMIRKLGGQIWLVRRPDREPSTTFKAKLRRLVRLDRPLHRSETLWRKLTVEQVLMNTGSEDELRRNALGLLRYARGE